VIGLVGGTVTAASRVMGHWISFATTLAMMIGLSIYVGWHSRTRRGTHWQKYGPTYLTVIAGVLIMLDLIRHVLEDTGAWTGSGTWGPEEYRSDCDSESVQCLSVVGWLITIGATYLGFVLLVIATMWNANICQRLKDIKEEWRRLRSEGS